MSAIRNLLIGSTVDVVSRAQTAPSVDPAYGHFGVDVLGTVSDPGRLEYFHS